MLSSKDFFKPTTYNNTTKDQLWCSIIADSHDSNCGCNWPFAHLLSLLFPPGHKDRDLTINQILQRDYQELCLSTTGEEDKGGLERGHIIPPDLKREDEEEEKEPGYIEDKDLTDLLAAATEEQRR